jgi:hypothetical protein
MEHLWRTESGRTSVQVLDEYYVTVTRTPPKTSKMAKHSTDSW